MVAAGSGWEKAVLPFLAVAAALTVLSRGKREELKAVSLQ